MAPAPVPHEHLRPVVKKNRKASDHSRDAAASLEQAFASHGRGRARSALTRAGARPGGPSPDRRTGAWPSVCLPAQYAGRSPAQGTPRAGCWPQKMDGAASGGVSRGDRLAVASVRAGGGLVPACAQFHRAGRAGNQRARGGGGVSQATFFRRGARGSRVWAPPAAGDTATSAACHGPPLTRSGNRARRRSDRRRLGRG